MNIRLNSSDITAINKLRQSKYLQRTGIRVNIQKLGTNKRCLAIRENATTYSIHSGVFFRKRSIETDKDNFSNMYDLYWDASQPDVRPEIDSSNTPYYVYDKIKSERQALAVINGAFYFLTDESERYPPELSYNLCIRKNQIFGLPSSDSPIAYISGGHLQTAEPSACGIIRVNRKKLFWSGAGSRADTNKAREAVLYNSSCAVVNRFRDPKSNIQVGVLDNKNIFTPKNPLVVDLVIKRLRNKLVVAKIRQGGGSHFFDGLFILQGSGSVRNIKKGDEVVPETLDGLNLTEIESAITIGKSIRDPYFNHPDSGLKRDARSILAKDINGYIHLIVFDGSKYIPGFNGVSARDIAPYFSPEKFKWAYFLDGGGSSRLIFRENNKLHLLANELAFKKREDGKILWDWRKSRQVASSISLYRINPRVHKNEKRNPGK